MDFTVDELDYASAFIACIRRVNTCETYILRESWWENFAANLTAHSFHRDWRGNEASGKLQSSHIFQYYVHSLHSSCGMFALRDNT